MSEEARRNREEEGEEKWREQKVLIEKFGANSIGMTGEKIARLEVPGAV